MWHFISSGGASRSKASPVNSSAVVVTSASRGVTIFEEEEEEDHESIKNRVIRRIDTRLIFLNFKTLLNPQNSY